MTNKKLTSVREYHFSGNDIRIAYHDGDDDTAKLQYNDKVFQGRALCREKTAAGLLITIQLEAIPDLQSVSLTLAIPEANCPQNMKSIAVTTFAIVSTHKTSFAGPEAVEGQLRTYELLELRGNAW